LFEPVLTLERIVCVKAKQPVVNGVSLQILAGAVTVIVGPSGAGKTTLLKTMTLLDVPDEGHLTVDGLTLDPKALKSGSRPGSLRWLRQRVGLVFQDLGLWPHMTVLENLTEAPVTLGLLSKKHAIEMAAAHCHRLGVLDKLDSFPDHLSGGQQQRVAIIRALMMQPKVLLIDEGTSALDPEWTQGIGQFLQELAAQGMAIVVVTHDIGFAQQIATHVVFMEQGKIILEGPSEVLFGPDQASKRWLAFVKRESAHV
jgi:ABC-type polar amino acid transport system ATPase subunit